MEPHGLPLSWGDKVSMERPQLSSVPVFGFWTQDLHCTGELSFGCWVLQATESDNNARKYAEGSWSWGSFALCRMMLQHSSVGLLVEGVAKAMGDSPLVSLPSSREAQG